MQCTQRLQAPQHFVCVCVGGDIPAPKKLKAPGKAVEIPGKHGKSRETRKKSREIPGHFSSVRIFITTALYKYMLCQP